MKSSGMWHEARKQEKMIRGMIVDYRRRAERRKDFYEKIKAEPTQFLQLHGRQCKIHLDPAVAAAGEGSAIMMPWQGDPDMMIDRFDVRAHLDVIPEVSAPDVPVDQLELEERHCNYERYRILAQNVFLGISEQKFLQQLAIEEQFGVTLEEKEHQKEKLNERKGGAAIGYNYDNPEIPPPTPSTSAGPSELKKVDKDSDDDSDLEIIDVDLSIDVNKMEASQAHELNLVGPAYGMPGVDLFSFLTGDADDAEHQKQLLREEKEKAMFSGRKSRRERRAHRDKKLLTRVVSPPSYAQPANRTADGVERDSALPRSRSHSPPHTDGDGEGEGEHIQFITSFGGDEEEKETFPPLPKPSYSEKVKQNLKKLELYSDVAKKTTARSPSVERPIGPRRLASISRSRSRSRGRSPYRSRSRSRSRYKSTSKSRSRSRHRSSSRSSQRSRYSSSSRSSQRSRYSSSSRSSQRSRYSSSSRSSQRSRYSSSSRSSQRSRYSSSSRSSQRSRYSSSSRSSQRSRYSSSSRSSRRSRYSSSSRSSQRSRYSSSSRSSRRSRYSSSSRSSQRSRYSSSSRSSQRSRYSSSSRSSQRSSFKSRSRSVCSRWSSRSRSPPPPPPPSPPHRRSRSRKRSRTPNARAPVSRYYGRRKEDKSSSGLSDSDSSEHDKKMSSGSKPNLHPGCLSRPRGSTNKVGSGGGRARDTVTLKDKLRRKMQAQLSRQLRADKKAESERLARESRRQATRDEEMRERAIVLRRKQREMRHQRSRGSSDEGSRSRSRSRSSRDSLPPGVSRDSRSRSRSDSPKHKPKRATVVWERDLPNGPPPSTLPTPSTLPYYPPPLPPNHNLHEQSKRPINFNPNNPPPNYNYRPHHEYKYNSNTQYYQQNDNNYQQYDSRQCKIYESQSQTVSDCGQGSYSEPPPTYRRDGHANRGRGRWDNDQQHNDAQAYNVSQPPPAPHPHPARYSQHQRYDSREHYNQTPWSGPRGGRGRGGRGAGGAGRADGGHPPTPPQPPRDRTHGDYNKVKLVDY